jgi:hypothetical protein
MPSQCPFQLVHPSVGLLFLDLEVALGEVGVGAKGSEDESGVQGSGAEERGHVSMGVWARRRRATREEVDLRSMTCSF